MNKSFALFLSSVVTLPYLLHPLTLQALGFNQAAAQTYLEAHNNNPWSTMALVELGAATNSTDYLKTITSNKAIDYEAPILAITSLNQDPRTFGASDYVAKLESFHTAGQIGDPTTLNDDIFGMLALISAGVPITDPAISDSKAFLLSHQNSDGGWGFTTTSTSDSNSTATALVALIASGLLTTDSHVQNALNYLKTAQNDDGGFTYDPKSTFGTSSDPSSTAWVIWALNSAAVDPASWSKSGNTPTDYLDAQQSAAGYFDSQDTSFTPTQTAYAVLALLGKTLPLHIINSSASTSALQYPFRIEGSSGQVCAGQTTGPTALDIIKNASLSCEFTYHITTSSSLGDYLDQINVDTASGDSGWLYFVDNLSPDIGAANYQLKAGDEVLWYYGNFGWIPTKLSISATSINSGASDTITIQNFNNGSWTDLAGATVYFGASSATTDSSGHATISPADGYYKIYAQKAGYVRSNQILVKVGNPNSSAVSLSAIVGSGGQVNGTSTNPSGLSFAVSPASLDFGSINPGQSSSKNLKLTNNGSANISIQSVVTGDAVFVDNLKINNLIWQSFEASLSAGNSQDATAKLAIPSSYSVSSGQKNGQLVFWATSQ